MNYFWNFVKEIFLRSNVMLYLSWFTFMLSTFTLHSWQWRQRCRLELFSEVFNRVTKEQQFHTTHLARGFCRTLNTHALPMTNTFVVFLLNVQFSLSFYREGFEVGFKSSSNIPLAFLIYVGLCTTHEFLTFVKWAELLRNVLECQTEKKFVSICNVSIFESTWHGKSYMNQYGE